jgi:urocanate hydratase
VTSRDLAVRAPAPRAAGTAMRHADAGYQIAVDCAKAKSLKLPMLQD